MKPIKIQLKYQSLLCLHHWPLQVALLIRPRMWTTQQQQLINRTVPTTQF
jgi:hypothetical protein